jgi:cell division protein FtsZ
MSIKLELPKLSDLKPRITVIGVGGAGCNAINNMIAAGLNGVEFVVANTDAQSLAASSADHRLQLGVDLTEGLGAGSKPDIGQEAAEEAIEDIRAQVAGSHMVFIAAGMGGGTGTGAASVIARVAKEAGILVVGIVTKPFHFEGTRRMRTAEVGIAEMRKHVDTLIVIPNQNLFRIANEKTTFAEAFVLADQVLYSGVACVVDLIIKEGLINLDFADVRTIMSGMGSAVMGTGEASGENRASLAAEEAIANPLLDEVSLRGAKGLLLSITGGHDLTLYEVDEAASRVRQEVDAEANIIVGATFDETLGDRVRVSIVASGIVMQEQQAAPMHGGVRPDMLPQPPPPASEPSFVPAGGPSDLRQRLSNAIGKPPQQRPNSAPPPVAPPVHQPHAASPHEGWQAPGNVVIEEGFSQLNWLGQSPHGHDRGGDAMGDVPEEFTPAPPADIRRGGRRMPDVDDFPPLAQREYRAKVGQLPDDGAPYDETHPQDDSRRFNILQRIMGRGRRGDEPDVTDSATRFFGRPQHEGESPGEEEAWWDENETGDVDMSPDQQPSMQAFFNRLRK